MSNVLYEALRDYVVMREGLDELLVLRNEAFKVFSKDCEIEKFDEIRNRYWTMLYSWNEKHYECGRLKLQNVKVARNAFLQVTNGMISRKQFSKVLSETRENVENYIEELEPKIVEKRRDIEKAYDDFVETDAGELKFIFESQKVKDIFMKFLLS